MHEMSYCEGVVEAVERRAAGRPVARVGVRIGAVHRVVADAFEQSFQIAAAGGPAEGATTELVVVPVRGHCMDCRADFDSSDPSPACPSCGSLAVAVEGGDEVVLEWLEYADSRLTADSPAELVPAHTHPPTIPGDHEGSDGLEPVRSFMITEEG
jgi:hydrogenase nickel incorporation protein HypA/HybF